MATIATVGRNQYRATFNQRSLRIDANGKTLVATDTVTGDTLTGAELHSVQALVTEIKPAASPCGFNRAERRVFLWALASL